MKIVGIDLAGKKTNPTTICFLVEEKIEFKNVFSDKEILDISKSINPDIIAIDAPIIRGVPKIRKADSLLKKYKAFPPTLPGMKCLTIRGSRLASQLLSHFKVIEVFPTATAKILNKYSKNFQETAANFNILVETKHELDAYLCCLTGKMYLEGNTVQIGDDEGKIIVPKLLIF